MKNKKDILKAIFITNKFLNTKHLDVLLAILYLSKGTLNENTFCFNISVINKVLYNTFEMTTKKKRYLKETIKYFIEENIIEVIDTDSENYEIKNTFLVNSKEDNFTIITLDELRKIAEIKVGKKDTIVNYYLKLLSTINNKTKVGYWTIEDLAEDISISTRTIIDYNEILENAKLIYIKRFNKTKTVSGKVQRLNNIYGRFADKYAIEEYAKDRISNLDRIEASNKLNANKSKSISKQYNDFVNGKYTGDVSSLYDKCKLYNKANPDKEKDLRVFDSAFNIDIDDEPTYKYINNDERFGNPFN